MNNQQAINLLKGLEQSLDDYCGLNDEGKTAFGMAITALELFGNSEQLPPVPIEQIARDIATIIENEKDMRIILKNAESGDWIPVKKHLPDKEGVYRVTDHKGDVVRYVFNDTDSSREYWERCVVAWMPGPEPYREDLIRRQDAVSALGERPLAWNEDEYELGLRNQWESDVKAILAVPPAPSLSAQPLDSKMRSRWIPVTNGRGGYECEHCHAYSPAYQSGDDYLSKFCPACGCEMEK